MKPRIAPPDRPIRRYHFENGKFGIHWRFRWVKADDCTPPCLDYRLFWRAWILEDGKRVWGAWKSSEYTAYRELCRMIRLHNVKYEYAKRTIDWRPNQHIPEDDYAL